MGNHYFNLRTTAPQELAPNSIKFKTTVIKISEKKHEQQGDGIKLLWNKIRKIARLKVLHLLYSLRKWNSEYFQIQEQFEWLTEGNFWYLLYSSLPCVTQKEPSPKRCTKIELFLPQVEKTLLYFLDYSAAAPVWMFLTMFLCARYVSFCHLWFK